MARSTTGRRSRRMTGGSTHANASSHVYDPWVKPGPKAHAYLVFGFALARANARMLLNADAKRRSSKNAVRTSRPRSVATA